jgi:O-methyltransferase/methyltransferase family protein
MTSLPDPSPVTGLVEGFRRSKIMFTALALGIFDRLHHSVDTASNLAAALGTDPDATERLLDACAALELLHKRDGVYSNTPAAGTYLFSGSPVSLCGYIGFSNMAMYPMWGHLEDAVREGSHRWKQTFGLDGPLFNHFFRTEESMRVFLRGMHGQGMVTSPKVVAAFDLGRFQTVADLGGGTGHLAIAACERYPQIRGVVFDLPGPAALAREHIALSPARERLQALEGDFFEDPLPAADLYALGRILHDWTEAKICRLLGRIFDRLPSGGALLIAEKLLNEDGVGPLWANLQSLNMLVMTEGKERSVGGYRRLLEPLGFVQIEGRPTEAYLDALLARKP